jgi:hypothetical protein
MREIVVEKGVKLIIRSDGFRILNFQDLIDVKSKRYKSYNTIAVSIGGVFEWRLLQMLDDLIVVIFLDAEIRNFSEKYCSGLDSIKKIKLINTQLSKNIDFKTFENLEELETEWLPAMKFDCSNLRLLVLRKTKAPSLEFLSNLGKLEALELLQGELPSLKGIEKITTLKALTLYSINKVDSVLPILKLLNLEYLDIRNFKGDIDIAILKPLVNLKWLVLENCYDVRNIQKLDDLKSLIGVKILGKTKVDGLIAEIHSRFPNGRYGYFVEKNIHDTLLEFYRNNPINF